MIKIGEKKLSLDTFSKLIKEKNIANRAPLAPACGLTLEDVAYDIEL